ncbi:ArsR/SmtB family transcription factor [Halorarius litoreus]|uniref:ArsR/SmtB family transcription factor n=1 Tax=Halorarius litoreus TaxID=2962676 RepID=UPI0020CBF7CB|nr:helix-turn-helix domain-containing protein [Halorarius litoreus]
MSSTHRIDEGTRLTPAEAFGIVGNETRLTILQVLVDNGERPMTFSDLRKRVGMRDGSQFNYHLKKLEGPFVTKTDGGYEIRHAGVNVIRTIVEGSFTEHPRIAPFETGGACVVCDAPLVAEYDHEMVFIQCSSCEVMHAMGMFPPGGVVGRTGHELLAAFEKWQRHDFALSSNGVCSMCGGRMDAILIRNPEEVHIGGLDLVASDFLMFGLGMKYPCTQCDAWDYGTPGMHLLTNPTVVEFHREHGIDLHAVPYWEPEWCISNERTTVVSEEPLRIEVAIRLDDEELRVTLDEAFEVRAMEQVPASP